MSVQLQIQQRRYTPIQIQAGIRHARWISVFGITMAMFAASLLYNTTRITPEFSEAYLSDYLGFIMPGIFIFSGGAVIIGGITGLMNRISLAMKSLAVMPRLILDILLGLCIGYGITHWLGLSNALQTISSGASIIAFIVNSERHSKPTTTGTAFTVFSWILLMSALDITHSTYHAWPTASWEFANQYFGLIAMLGGILGGVILIFVWWIALVVAYGSLVFRYPLAFRWAIDIVVSGLVLVALRSSLDITLPLALLLTLTCFLLTRASSETLAFYWKEATA